MQNKRQVKAIWEQIKIRFRLQREEHETVTYKEIADGTRLSSFNLWTLFFAMVIASVGLIADSISAVIGAMLISPLMGPIVGFGFSIAINDNLLKKTAIANWILMTVSCLTASVLFFLISPFDHNTSVLLSFTRASILDIIIAFFGGLAGFIGIIRNEGTKVIAGVAVATACIPPLCTAGFGLAHLDWITFAGAIYFYLTNCLFIGLATFFISRIAGYNEYFCKDLSKQKTASWLWITTIVLMTIPGILIAIKKWKDEHNNNAIDLDTKEERIKQLEREVKRLDSLWQTYRNND
jgi:uncharacterized hydrophobic protein (TIGR00271 family)